MASLVNLAGDIPGMKHQAALIGLFPCHPFWELNGNLWGRSVERNSENPEAHFLSYYRVPSFMIRNCLKVDSHVHMSLIWKQTAQHVSRGACRVKYLTRWHRTDGKVI